MPSHKISSLYSLIYLILLISLSTLYILGVLSPAAFVFLNLIACFVFLLTEQQGPEICLGSSLLNIFVGSYLSPNLHFLSYKESISGFASPTIITIASLFVVAQAVQTSGTFNQIAQRLTQKAESSEKLIAQIALPLSGLSAFFNNTPIVMIFMPNLRNWAKENHISVSKIFIPLSYLTIIGGTCTLIGTSTNLLVDGLYRESFQTNLDFFSITKLALPCAIVATFYMIFIAPKLLPSVKDPLRAMQESNRDFLFQVTVPANSYLVRKSIEEAELRNLDGLFLFEVIRKGRIHGPVQKEFVLEAEDQLIFKGDHHKGVQIAEKIGATETQKVQDFTHGEDSQILEVMIGNNSPLINRSIDDLWFNRRYNATVLSVQRNEKNYANDFAKLPLKAGDTLLLLADIGFRRMWQNSKDFVFITPLREDLFKTDKQKWILPIFLLMILLPVLGVLPIHATAPLAAIMVIFLKILGSEDYLKTIDWKVLLVIAVAIGISRAVLSSGLASDITNYILKELPQNSDYTPILALAVLYITTNIMTEFITNNAAAALNFPLAIKLAEQLDISPMPLIMSIMIASSASFATPIGYQTNLMVYAPGGYKYGDFVRVGLPLNILYAIMVIILAPKIWPF
ncbi:MAG: SLC13 family permease [Lentisphaeria bacterium]|nr:SLC13 family permease [Lentisphaeria bacterium]